MFELGLPAHRGERGRFPRRTNQARPSTEGSPIDARRIKPCLRKRKTFAAERSGLYRAARLTAEMIALKLARIVDGSIPQPHSVWPATSHST